MSLTISFQTPANCTLNPTEWTQNIANAEFCDGKTAVMTCNASGWQTSWSGNVTTSPELRRKALLEIFETVQRTGQASAGVCTSFTVAKPSENWAVGASKPKTNSASKWSAAGSFSFAVALVATVAGLMSSL
ncbi:hypothetical protein HDU96_010276 [Phlyctochytrium bullatum]|nr:hypothetical protein HDU96_010276 [Phlyctochytrium bullatum]